MYDELRATMQNYLCKMKEEQAGKSDLEHMAEGIYIDADLEAAIQHAELEERRQDRLVSDPPLATDRWADRSDSDPEQQTEVVHNIGGSVKGEYGSNKWSEVGKNTKGKSSSQGKKGGKDKSRSKWKSGGRKLGGFTSSKFRFESLC